MEPRRGSVWGVHGECMGSAWCILKVFHSKQISYPSWFLSTHYSSLTHYSLLLPTTYYLLPTTHHLLLTAYYSPLTTHHSLLTTHYYLRVTTYYSPLTTFYHWQVSYTSWFLDAFNYALYRRVHVLCLQPATCNHGCCRLQP